LIERLEYLDSYYPEGSRVDSSSVTNLIEANRRLSRKILEKELMSMKSDKLRTTPENVLDIDSTENSGEK